jgi:tetratricopeptide (TPR) repeat protein
MNRNTVLILLKSCAFFILVICFSNCKPTDNSKKLLAQALKNKDYATAAFAYNNLLLADTNNLEWKDSLARIYIKSGNYEGGVALGEQVLVKQPKNLKLLELVGIGNGRLIKLDKSLANFNSLFVATNDYTYLYKMAGISYDNENYNMADSLADIMIAKADTSKKIIVQLPDGSDQIVPLVAACYNMKGAILADLFDKTGNPEHVKNSIPLFEKAIQIYPDFKFPKLYLQRIAQYIQGSAK